MNVRQILFFVVTLFVILSFQKNEDRYDLIIKNGHVIDPRNGIDRVMDVAVLDDKIIRVDTDIPVSDGAQVIDATGFYVTPGLIDIHSHNFHGTQPNSRNSNGFYALPPDGFTFRSGVTTVVDVGGAGWRNFPSFKEQVIDRSETRVLSFLHMIGHGLKGGHVVQNLNDMDPKMTALMARRYPDTIVGIKLAHYVGHDWEPIHRVVETGELAGVPVMIDFGSANPPLPLETLFMEKLRPGDIYTHAYGGGGSGRESILDENSVLRTFVFDAQERGIVFDVGHGAGSFFYRHAVPASEQGFKPNTISTDLYRESMNGGLKSLTNLMSKFMHLNMTLQEVILRTTWAPAQVIQREDLGHLSEGAVADIAILNLREGNFGFIDAAGVMMEGATRIESEATIRAGRIVWDLNGIGALQYDDR